MEIPAGSPNDVDPKYRKYAWPIYVALVLGFIAFVIFTIVTAVGERKAPPTDVKIARLRYKQPGYVVCFEDLVEGEVDMTFDTGEDGPFCELTRAKRPDKPLPCQADQFSLYQRTIDPTAQASIVLGQAMQETLFANDTGTNDTAAGGGSGEFIASGDGYPDTYDFYGGDYSSGYNFDGGKAGSTKPYKTLSIKPCVTNPKPAGETDCTLLRKCMVFNADTILKKKDKVKFGTWGWTFTASNTSSYTESFVLNILLPECIPKNKKKEGVIPNSTTEVDAFDKMLACMYKSALDPFDLAWGFNNGVPSMEQTKYLAGNTKREYDLALQPVSYVENNQPRNDFLAVDVTMRTELVVQVEEQDPLNPTVLMGTIGGFWNYVALVFGFFFVKTMPVSGMAMFKFGAVADKLEASRKGNKEAAKDEETGQAAGKGEADKAVEGAKKEAKKEAKDAAKDAAKEEAGEAAGAIGLDSLGGGD